MICLQQLQNIIGKLSKTVKKALERTHIMKLCQRSRTGSKLLKNDQMNNLANIRSFVKHEENTEMKHVNGECISKYSQLG